MAKAGKQRRQLPTEPDWAGLGAACMNNPSVNEDWFHPDKLTAIEQGLTVERQVQLAKAVCLGECPIKCFKACHEYSLELSSTQALGVMAGLTDVERRPLRKERNQKAS